MCDHGKWNSCVRSSAPCIGGGAARCAGMRRSDDDRLLSYINFFDNREERREKMRHSERQQQQQPIIVFEGERGGAKGCGDNPNCKIPNCQVHPSSCVRSCFPDPITNAFRHYSPFPNPYGAFGLGVALGARPPWAPPFACGPPSPYGPMLCGPSPPMGCPPPLGWCTACGQKYPNTSCGCTSSGNTSQQGGSQPAGSTLGNTSQQGGSQPAAAGSTLDDGNTSVQQGKSSGGPPQPPPQGRAKSMADGARKSMAPPGQRKSMAPSMGGGGARKSLTKKSMTGSTS